MLLPIHLLLVDGDALLRGMTAESLRQDGFHVAEVGCGRAAIALFESGSFQLMLLDVMMPGENGFDICRHIRATAKGATLPILMLTGLCDSESIDRAFLGGATDFISKPVNLTLLSHRVRHAVHASAAAADLRHQSASLARSQRMAGAGSWRISYDSKLACSVQLAWLFGTTVEMLALASPASLLERVAPRKPRPPRARLAVRSFDFSMRRCRSRP